MRCDCGEQLDEAIRHISLPQPHPRISPSSSHATIPGRGAVIYLRQEGRGIGLLAKIRAYNLQDMGYDTVAANQMLGFGADERVYEIAAAILRDLGLAGEESDADASVGIRLLTNNPDKMQALTHEGVRIRERVPMVPRTWTDTPSLKENDRIVEEQYRRKDGATMIGGGAAHGPELERYLRTKVQRMGHLLELPTMARPAPPGIEIVIPKPQPSDAFSEVASSPTANIGGGSLGGAS